MLAERRAGKDQVDEQRRAEVGEHEKGRAAGQRPEIEQLVGEQHGDEEQDADPLAAERRRPAARRPMEAAARVAHEDERTAGAEQIAGREERDDQQSAVVHPREDGGEIVGCKIGTDEAVEDENDRGDEQDELDATARAASAGTGPTTGQRRTSVPTAVRLGI